jgi:hypothetical protein
VRPIYNARAVRQFDRTRPPNERESRSDANACLKTLAAYRRAAVSGRIPAGLRARARRAFLHLGGDPARGTASLRDYDHERYGPFLGVSDEGSAAGAIRAAALASPKVRALQSGTRPEPLVIGVALDAERLGGVGEIAVGPEEYADIWLDCVDRLLVTTNIGTRVNIRNYLPEPRVTLFRADRAEIAKARTTIAAKFTPFVETPDGKPRPFTVLIDFHNRSPLTAAKKRAVLSRLARWVKSGKAAGRGRAPRGHRLGLVAWVGLGPKGRDQALAAIDLAARAGLDLLVVDGVKRKEAASAISLAGLLDYFRPGLVGPLVREARKRGVTIRAANLPDTDTIARSTWVGLNTARTMGANLGKYGCFPLTLREIDHVVEQVQAWLPEWSAAPVFFVDQGLMRDGFVDVESDLPRGLEAWLDTVAAHGVRIVLIDTVDKSTGRRLLKKTGDDRSGYLTPAHIARVERYARSKGIKTLWAGGFQMSDAYELGRLGVFGIYVTSAAATTIAVAGSYVRDPALAGVKEPSREAVLRTKILLEAGFLSAALGDDRARPIAERAERLLATIGQAKPDAGLARRDTAALARVCVRGWRAHWRKAGRR